MIEARRSFKSLVMAMMLIVAVLALLSLADWRFAVVAMMVVCIVIPMILLLAWLRLTATKEMQLHIRPQRWTRLNNNQLQVQFFPFAIDSTDEDNPEPVATAIIEKENIESIESSKKFHKIFLLKPLPGTYRCFIIPSNIIKDIPQLLLNL